MSERTSAELIAALEACALTPAEFDHRAHVQAGFAYLQQHGYAGALTAMASALRAFARSIGKDGLYHETVTVAFLTLIHERMAEDLIALGLSDPQLLAWEPFARRHPDLFTGNLLARYYSGEQLKSELAKRCFLLPKVR
jgi:hypothetical protein